MVVILIFDIYTVYFYDENIKSIEYLFLKGGGSNPPPFSNTNYGFIMLFFCLIII